MQEIERNWIDSLKSGLYKGCIDNGIPDEIANAKATATALKFRLVYS